MVSNIIEIDHCQYFFWKW